MMSCLGSNQSTKYIQSACKTERSFLLMVIQFVQPEFTLSLPETHDEYAIDIIRSKLSRDISGIFQELREELVMAMDDLVPRNEQSTWQSPG